MLEYGEESLAVWLFVSENFICYGTIEYHTRSLMYCFLQQGDIVAVKEFACDSPTEAKRE